MNHPLECPSCSAAVWRFDMKKHFTIAHPEEEIPEVAILSEAEEKLSKKRFTESRFGTIGRQRACSVAFDRVLGLQE